MKCSKCNMDKSLNDFVKRGKSFRNICKSCSARYSSNRDIERKQNAVKLLGSICMDCKSLFPYQVMHFHHRDPALKDFNFSSRKRRKWDTVVIELLKCDLLCANCHIKRHNKVPLVGFAPTANRLKADCATIAPQGHKACTKCGTTDYNDFYVSKSHVRYCKQCFSQYMVARWIELKKRVVIHMGRKCLDCNINHDYQVFHLHHLDPLTKDVDWRHLRKRSWDKILIELDKCVLLCANCHVLRHAKYL